MLLNITETWKRKVLERRTLGMFTNMFTRTLMFELLEMMKSDLLKVLKLNTLK